VTDQELRDYESTGKKMREPKVSKPKPVQAKRILSQPTEITAPVTKKLYIHINDPDDHDSLLSLKKVCSDYVGESDIILVLGAQKKSAIKLPFKVDLSKELVAAMTKILGEEKVVVK
jgi:hypothetical protein